MSKNKKEAEKILEKIGTQDQFIQIIKDLEVDFSVKSLWINIFINATTEREFAMSLYLSALKNMPGNASDHVTVGQVMVKYLERANKANEQLLSLATKIQESLKKSNKEAEIDKEMLLNQLNN